MVGLPTGGMRLYRKYLFDREDIQADWSRGLVSDMPPSAMPPGSVVASNNLFFDQPGKGYKRGGTSYQGSVPGSDSSLSRWIAVANFSGNPRIILGINSISIPLGGYTYDVTTTASNVGGADTGDVPKFFVDRLIVPAGGTSILPAPPVIYYLSSGTVTQATMGGSPPDGQFCAVHAGRAVLANDTINLNRVWFSPAILGNPGSETTWDTTSAWVDTDHEVTALASMNGVLLVFSETNIQRIVGTVPPGTTNFNMQLQPLADVGCSDARSIASIGGNIVFANHQGIYLTNGSSVRSLTDKPDGTGISRFWRSNFDPRSVACGVFADTHLFVSSRSSDMGLICYLPRQTWWKVTGLNLNSFSFLSGSSLNTASELYASGRSEARAFKLSGLFSPASGNKNDANGTAVTWSMTTRMIGEGTGVKRYGFSHLTYDMRDAASDNPTLALTVNTGIEEDTTSTPAESPLIETTTAQRKRFTVNKDAQAVSLTLAQSNASSKTEIYAIETEYAPYAIADGQ